MANHKAYKVSLIGETEPRIIEANDAIEDSGRVKFTGIVEGHSSYSGSDVVASFLSAQVVEYGVVPVPQEVRVGQNTYSVVLVSGDTHTVQSDEVRLIARGDSKPGQLNFVTKVRAGEPRTEYLISEDKVEYIVRTTDTGEISKIVPSQGAQDASLPAGTASA